MNTNAMKKEAAYDQDASLLDRTMDKVKGAESSIVQWMERYRIMCLQVSLGVVFFVFGFLKFFPGMSPAEKLAGDTLQMMSLGLVPPMISLPLLAAWECMLGIGLILGHTQTPVDGSGPTWRNYLLRLTLPALFLHMLGTVTPTFLMPDCVFGLSSGGPLLTLECQYIIKNLVIVSAAIAVGGQQLQSLQGTGED